ncbi:MAG: hypothetical protein BWX69_03040 [Planctomycetes bacterium ADurb.Bin069]|nr:MAG: hypothetical protein BWX69_03040 [Planctomycetes bacterium ADurb.Bin069]
MAEQHYTVWLTATGQPVRAGFLDTDLLELVTGESLLAGEALDLASGWVDPGTGLPTSRPSDAEPIEAVRARGVAQVNVLAGVARSRWLTDIPGQAEMYADQEREAADWMGAGEPVDLTGYPMLAAMTGIVAPTTLEVAQVWRTTAGNYRYFRTQIEVARQTAIIDIAAATTAAAVQAVVDAVAALVEA